MSSFILWLIIICWRLGLSTQLPLNPLNGEHLRVIWTLWNGNPKGLSGPLKGGVILDFLSARFNFTYEMVRVTENNCESTANRKGLFSLLLENKSDLLVDGVLLTSERNKIVDVSYPWSNDVLTALIPIPEVGSNLNAVVKPFQWEVWLSLGISIVIVIFVSNHVHRPLESYFSSKSSRTDSSSSSSGRRKKKPAGQYLYVFGNLLSQGGPCQFTRLSFRLVAGCWTLAAFVLVQAYTSTLFTYVVLPVNSPLINSIYDITVKEDVKLVVRTSSAIDLILSILSGESSTELSRKLLEKVNSFPNSRCILRSDCIRLVKPSSKTVFLDARPYLLDAIKERYEKTGKCELQLTKEGFYNYIAGLALPKNSPYTQTLNLGIIELHQTGFVDYWDTWFRPMPWKCNRYARSKQPAAGNQLSPLSLRNLTGAFAILAAGYTVSCLAFLFELLMTQASKRFRKKS